MDVKVTIIVTSKNCEEYIGKCLNSLINQSLREIEILIIDAFSSDRTRAIVNEYISKDNRIKLLDDEKSSTGYSINKGIRIANGKYIGIVEPDDYIDENAYEVLYREASVLNLDYIKAIHYHTVVSPKGYFYEERVSHFDISMSYLIGKTINPQRYPNLFIYDTARWNGIYKTDFLRDKKIISNETKGAAYQDLGFLFQVLSKAELAKYIDMSFYHYRIDNPNASMKNKLGISKLYDEWLFSKKLFEQDKVNLECWNFFYYKFIRGLLIGKSAYAAVAACGEEVFYVFEKIRNEYIEGINAGRCDLIAYDYETARQIRLLISDINLFCEYWHSFYYTRECVLDEICSDDTDTIIFGTGKTARRLFLFLAMHDKDKNVKAFCDNNSQIQYTTLFKRYILPVEEAVSNYKNTKFIITSEFHFREMRDQLYELNVPDVNIFDYKFSSIEI